jgi:hypothetical protein
VGHAASMGKIKMRIQLQSEKLNVLDQMEDSVDWGGGGD